MFPTVVAEAFYGNMDIMFTPTAITIPGTSMLVASTMHATIFAMRAVVVAVVVAFPAVAAPAPVLVPVPVAVARDAVKRTDTTLKRIDFFLPSW